MAAARHTFLPFFGRAADPGRHAQVRDLNTTTLSLLVQIVRWASPKALTDPRSLSTVNA